MGFFAFFFFKQKTAYEMRISDWSSDVCSSDLHPLERPGLRHPVAEMTDSVFVRGAITECKTQKPHPTQPIPNHILRSRIGQIMLGLQNQDLEHHDRVKRRTRSEEHPSELQSLMRISYAVFCLKKKNEHQ